MVDGGGGHLGWQPSRFLTDRTEAERGFALAERLGSVNAAAQERTSRQNAGPLGAGDRRESAPVS